MAISSQGFKMNASKFTKIVAFFRIVDAGLIVHCWMTLCVSVAIIDGKQEAQVSFR